MTKRRGQGLTEYGLILVLVLVISAITLALFGGEISTMLSTMGSSI